MKEFDNLFYSIDNNIAQCLFIIRITIYLFPVRKSVHCQGDVAKG